MKREFVVRINLSKSKFMRRPELRHRCPCYSCSSSGRRGDENDRRCLFRHSLVLVDEPVVAGECELVIAAVTNLMPGLNHRCAMAPRGPAPAVSKYRPREGINRNVRCPEGFPSRCRRSRRWETDYYCGITLRMSLGASGRSRHWGGRRFRAVRWC